MMTAVRIAAVAVLVFAVAADLRLISHTDDLRATHAANAAQLRLVRAELELLRVRAYMAPEQPRVAIDQLCRDRVDALRDGIRVLVRVGKVELEDYPGMRWRSWE